MSLKKCSLLMFFVSLTSFSQDIITKRDGSIIETKIIEINNSEIKYKKINNLDGPLYVLIKSDVNQIKYENGEVDLFHNTDRKINKDYIEREKSNISSIFLKGNKAYIEKKDDANDDDLDYFKSSLESWKYWEIVEDKSDADFVIVFSLKKKMWADKEVKAILKTLNGKLYLETKSYTGNGTIFNGYDGYRSAINKLIEKFFMKRFK